MRLPGWKQEEGQQELRQSLEEQFVVNTHSPPPNGLARENVINQQTDILVLLLLLPLLLYKYTVII